MLDKGCQDNLQFENEGWICQRYRRLTFSQYIVWLYAVYIEAEQLLLKFIMVPKNKKSFWPQGVIYQIRTRILENHYQM